MVELTRTFNEVWQSLCCKSVDLRTDSETPFIAKARMARRRGSSVTEVLVFQRTNESGELIECSRCYSEDWGHYFNHLGKQGQRVGMYAKTVDRIVV